MIKINYFVIKSVKAMADEFIQQEIKALDAEIDAARKTLSVLENEPNKNQDNKTSKVLKAKLADWIQKRDRLVELMIKPMRKM